MVITTTIVKRFVTVNFNLARFLTVKILWPVFHYQIPDHPKSKYVSNRSGEKPQSDMYGVELFSIILGNTSKP